MRECQLCGAKSWGPIQPEDGPAILQMPHFWGKDIDFSKLLKCDVCGLIADRPRIETPLPDAEFVSPLLVGKPLTDPLEIARETLEGLSDRFPVPQTRLERIVRAIIAMMPDQYPNALSTQWAESVVKLARAIESEMDRCALTENPARS
jgi:hypothetical protein